MSRSRSADERRHYEQSGYRVRFGWGAHGLVALAPHVEAVVIVDVLSFSTSVDIALSRGVTVFPYRWHDGTEHTYALAVDAVVARRDGAGFGLRPSSLIDAPAGLRLVLPSPNGSTLTFGAADAGAAQIMVACLRNASAVADALSGVESVAVIAAGERWSVVDGPLRPAIEDLLGAGRIIAELGLDSASPEAAVAAAAASGDDNTLADLVRASTSGLELGGRGRADDVELAVEIDRSTVVATLQGDCLRPASS